MSTERDYRKEREIENKKLNRRMAIFFIVYLVIVGLLALKAFKII